MFEHTLLVSDLQSWLDEVPLPARHGAIERARQCALAHGDPVAAARVLLEIGQDGEAEARLLSLGTCIRGGDYGLLVPLAEALEGCGRILGATVVYRALLQALLERAYTPAYPHGARYWVRLQALAASASSLTPLEDHAAFVEAVRTRHGRKTRFWQCVRDIDPASAPRP